MLIVINIGHTCTRYLIDCLVKFLSLVKFVRDVTSVLLKVTLLLPLSKIDRRGSQQCHHCVPVRENEKVPQDGVMMTHSKYICQNELIQTIKLF